MTPTIVVLLAAVGIEDDLFALVTIARKEPPAGRG